MKCRELEDVFEWTFFEKLRFDLTFFVCHFFKGKMSL